MKKRNVPFKWRYKKIIRYLIMSNFSFLFVFVFAFQAQAKLSGQQVFLSINAENASMKEVINEIKERTDYSFVYSDRDFIQFEKRDVKFERIGLEELLDYCLEGSGLEYEILDKTIIIRRKEHKSVAPTSKTVTGTIKDANGELLPGVTVVIKGTHVGVTSDKEGMYKITIPDVKDVVLVFSFMGMETQEIVFKGEDVLNVVMEEKVESLGDVVVTGYANIRKESFTGSSVRVTREELLRVTNRNLIDALQVFDPSLRIITNNEMGSDPNTLPEFNIRGISGLGSLALDETSLKNNPNAPVFILDGFEATLEKIYDLDLNRVESMTILKDAAATAIYGSRAANGVIVIETVAPKAGKFNVSYSLVGTLTVPDLSDYNLMNAREKIEAEEAAGFYVPDENASTSAKRALELERIRKWDRVNRGVDTYWLGLPLRNEVNHKHSVYIDGGNENIRLGIDMRYDGQGGVMKGSYRDRVGAGLTIDYRMKRLIIRNNVSFDNVKSKVSPYGVFSTYAQKLPYDLYKDEAGNYLRNLQVEYDNFSGWHANPGDTYNPLYEAKVSLNFNKTNTDDFVNNLSIDWYIVDAIRFRGQLSLNKVESFQEIFKDPISGEFTVSDQYPGSLQQMRRIYNELNSNLFLNYIDLIGYHNINFSIGVNTVEKRTKTSLHEYVGFPAGHLSSPQFAAMQKDKGKFADNHTRLFGMFTSLNYTYKDVYLFDASFRMDGSSEFGADKKYAPFWSLGAGVNLHYYEFLQLKWLDQFKVRVSYGQTGKVNFSAYASKNMYDIQDEWYDTGSGVMISNYGNKNLKWEVTNKFNAGTDLQFMGNRLSLKFDYYTEITKNSITTLSVPLSTGFSHYYANIGEVKNTGFEIYTYATPYVSKDWVVNVFINLAHSKNKIVKISDALRNYNEKVYDKFDEYNQVGPFYKDPKYAVPILQYEEGGSMTSIYGMKSLGINPADGEEIFVKPDGTITYTWDSREQQILGNTEPDATGSFGLDLRYKNFTMSASFIYEFGGDIYNLTLAQKVEGVDLWNYNADKRVFTERWKKAGDKAKFKSIGINNVQPRPSSRFVQKNNTVKFNSFTVGYNFNPELLRKMGISAMRAQVNLKDVATISNVKQERGTSYPFARSYDLSLNITF